MFDPDGRDERSARGATGRRSAPAAGAVADGSGGERAADVPDYGELVNGLACRETGWLRERRAWLVREQRRLHVEELAVTRVLDDRGAFDDSLAQADGVSIRQVRDTLATARALEDLPEIAAVAARGDLSDDQLTQVVRVAEPGDTHDDHRWAAEAASWSPADLAQQARLKRAPTAEEGAARRATRELRFWWRRDQGMLDGRFSLPDIDGALFEAVINHMVDRMRPAKGQPWDTRARRGADALVELVREYSDVQAVSGPGFHLVVEVPLEGPALLAGVPLPDAMVEAVRARATIEPVVVGDDGTTVATGRRSAVVSPKKLRAVRLRDGKCRVPGCDRRTGLEAHHLVPSSWGGSDDIHNLAMVCTGGGTDHHAQLVPHGPWILTGNPNDTNGLSLLHRDDFPSLAALGAEHAAAEARAGPTAA